ncbi:LysR family transcriptional regulator [Chromobacterium piscinae]|uniref:LysR family transcriptional regulator n=1 Tax=Chromobacterium piscinae TaxID=686831 RepID=UPI001E5685D6|nr:LysR family transcriptional regulator [Chromobacterium piscinae]MCD5330229.1 LysR family transcriptional regulator [Chromobacterium piscinae]
MKYQTFFNLNAKMNSVSDVAFFLEVVKAGTLSGAAQELGVSTAAVSRRLANLEARLGIRLLNRTTRRTAITYEGELYLAEGKKILGDLEELEQRLASAQSIPKGLLRVNATFGFGRQFIAPAIADFVEIYPDVDVQLSLSDRPANLIEEGFDVCIRFGEMPDARVTSRKIASNRRLLCASPAYLECFGVPVSPMDLQRHRCIVIRESDETYGAWHLHSGAAQANVKVRGTVSTNDGEAAVNWALRGLGILLRSEWNVAPYLRSGRLREVLGDWRFPAADIHAVYPMKNNLSAKVRAFVSHLDKHFDPYRPRGDGKSGW